MERHILREGLLPISSSRSQWVPTLATPCKLVRDASNRLRIPRSTVILSIMSKSDHMVLIKWSPFGYTHLLYSTALIVLSYPCLLITAWQLVKAHGVTRNEPKIHVICYITPGPFWPGVVETWQDPIYESNKHVSHLQCMQTND